MADPVDQLEGEGLENQSSPDQSKDESSASLDTKAAEGVFDLDKVTQKVRFQGQEYSLKDLQQAFLRQKDYTQKTQSLAEERKAIDAEKKDREFSENLYADLKQVRDNPNLAGQFLSIYPEKYHRYLKEVLSEGGPAKEAVKENKGPQQDFETLSKLNKMEKFIAEQEVTKHSTEFKSQIDSMAAKYPDAVKEWAIARIYEQYNGSGKPPTAADWDAAFKSVDAQVKDLVKSRYGDMVKKQTEANKKGRDVESGGGTVGRAPPKFNNLGDVTKHAIASLTGKN